MIRIKNIDVGKPAGGLFEGSVELVFTNPREGQVLAELAHANEDLAVYFKHAADDISGRIKGGKSWRIGNKLKCLTAEGAFSLQRGTVYTFDGFNRGGRVRLKEFPKTTFDASRFEPITSLVTYGDPGKGKTILGHASGSVKIEGTFDTCQSFVQAMATQLGLKPDDGKKKEQEPVSKGELYVHDNNQSVNLPGRRTRKGRTFTP